MKSEHRFGKMIGMTLAACLLACGSSESEEGAAAAAAGSEVTAAETEATSSAPAADTRQSATELGGGPIPADPSLLTEELAALEIINLREPFPGVYSAGQLTAEQFKTLSGMGYRLVSLQMPGEQKAGWEERVTEKQGVDFTRIPVNGEKDITEEKARELAATLDAGEETPPTVVYCRSGNRVGALFALKAHFVDGAGTEEAMEIGYRAGMNRLRKKVAEVLATE